ncbi:MAG: CopD family protein, partial [Nitratireductor sp.]|nr:CopD family protein [Nitratireductor sp.]
WMAWDSDVWSDGWFVVKLVAVLAMSAAHGLLARGVRLFAEDRNPYTSRQWRMINEIPTLLMIIIVVMVIVRPL